MEAGSRRKRRRRRSGRCKDSSETRSASPVEEKTGEGGRGVHENKRGGSVRVRRERRSKLESMREKAKLTRKHNYGDSEQLDRKKRLLLVRQT